MLGRVPGDFWLYAPMDCVHRSRAYRPMISLTQVDSAPSSYQKCLPLSPNPFSPNPPLPGNFLRFLPSPPQQPAYAELPFFWLSSPFFGTRESGFCWNHFLSTWLSPIPSLKLAGVSEFLRGNHRLMGQGAYQRP